jgi:hypothetical protein
MRYEIITVITSREMKLTGHAADISKSVRETATSGDVGADRIVKIKWIVQT